MPLGAEETALILGNFYLFFQNLNSQLCRKFEDKFSTLLRSSWISILADLSGGNCRSVWPHIQYETTSMKGPNDFGLSCPSYLLILGFFSSVIRVFAIFIFLVYVDLVSIWRRFGVDFFWNRHQIDANCNRRQLFDVDFTWMTKSTQTLR